MNLKLSGNLIDSARSATRDRSQEQRLDDELMSHPDTGCQYSPRCLDCTRVTCKHDKGVRT